MTPFTKYLLASFLAVASAAASHSPSQAITGGTLVKTGELPFMRIIESVFPSNNGHKSLCSGALIAENLVLTAAHCAMNYKGEKATSILIATSNSKGEVDPESISMVTDVYHPSGYPRDHHALNDIAVLKLEKSFPNAVTADTLLTARYPVYKKEMNELHIKDPKGFPKDASFLFYLRDDEGNMLSLLRTIPLDKEGNYIVHAAGYGPKGCLIADPLKCKALNNVLYRVKLKLSQLTVTSDGKADCKELRKGDTFGFPFCYSQTAVSLADKPKKADDTLAYGQNQGDSGGPLFVYNKDTKRYMIIGVSCCTIRLHQYNTSLELTNQFLQGVYDPEGYSAAYVTHFQLQSDSH